MGRWLVTGAAGFIGAHLTQRLLGAGHHVVGVDDLNGYYSQNLKRARLAALTSGTGFTCLEADVADEQVMDDVFVTAKPDVVVHLAAQAGVRFSVDAPLLYAHTNLMGFSTVLELARRHHVDHLVYASSSSVYGETSQTPFAERNAADHPVSFYGATKRANELMAHSYAHLYGLPCTGLRFFTVYGPWGRPDMAYWRFTEALVEGRELTVFGDGSALRDFTYIDDIVEAIVQVGEMPPDHDPGWAPTSDLGRSSAPWRLFNIGHGSQITVAQLIALLEDLTGIPARLNFVARQPGDVPATHADTSALRRQTGFVPKTPVEDGLA